MFKMAEFKLSYLFFFLPFCAPHMLGDKEAAGSESER